MSEQVDSVPVQPGDVIDAKYRIDAQLGAGGMGTVMAATHLHLGQRVAIKFLSPEISRNEDGMARFTREAQISVQIKSEHVARTTDIGALPDGTPYIVMELLDGHDIADRLAQAGPFAIQPAVELLLQACEAIAEAHALGIVHRDLKPQNLFIARRPDGSDYVKVLDFGISKVLPSASGSAGSMTRTNTVMGSPMYMSPEQMASSRTVDVRTDIWALGATLYEMLTGTPPFQAETLPELCIKVLTWPTPALRQMRPDAPPGLESVLLRALEKDPAQRYPNLAAFCAELGPFAPESSHAVTQRISRIMRAAGLSDGTESVPGSALPTTAAVQATSVLGPPPATGPVPMTQSTSGRTMSTWSQTRGSSSDRRWVLVAGVLAMIVMGGLAGGVSVWWMVARRDAFAANQAAQASHSIRKEEASAAPSAVEPRASAAVPANPSEEAAASADASASADTSSAASAAPSAIGSPETLTTPRPRAAVAPRAPAATTKPRSARPSAPPTSRASSPPDDLPSDRVGTTSGAQPRNPTDELMMDRR